MIDLVGAILEELEIKKRGVLNEKHCYGLAHPLIGKPCLYKDSIEEKLRYAIPYGAYVLDKSALEHVAADRVRTPLLAIAYYAHGSPYEGKTVDVKALVGIKPSELIPIDTNSRLALLISHTILSWLVDNRDHTFSAEERRRKQSETTPTIAQSC